VNLHGQYCEKFRMLKFSAEKQPSIFTEFFNSIGTLPTLRYSRWAAENPF
jgi:hypothetical protein